MINVFTAIFSGFLDHTVIVFNKWGSFNITGQIVLKNIFQKRMKNEFNFEKIPCFFVDSVSNLKIMRENSITKNVYEEKSNKKIKEKTRLEANYLINYLKIRKSRCDVRRILPNKTRKIDEL